MALIVCPECDQRISDRAAACPSCGYPINENRKNTQVIEQTGKKWKIHRILASILCVIGIIIILPMIEPDPLANVNISLGQVIVGMGFMGAGLIWLVFAGFFAWWYHG